MSHVKTFSFSAWLLGLALAVQSPAVTAQTLYGWGHPVYYATNAQYGAGYVGSPSYANPAYANTVGYPQATSFYRAPQVGGYGYTAPVTTYYAPSAYPATTAYYPSTAYPTAAAPNFVGAGAAVANTSYYAPVGNYPAQTVLPTNFVAAPPRLGYRPPSYPGYQVNYAPAYGAGYSTNYAANYASPAFYRTNYARTPVTYYRPVLVADPYTGGTATVLQPAQGYEWQTRRQETYRLFPLFNRNPQPAAVPTPCGTCANGTCANGSCNTSPAAAPYYAPANVAPALPAGTYPSATYPSSSQPFIASPSTSAPSGSSGGVFPSGPTTISPPATFTPSTSVAPGGSTFITPGTAVPPASTTPSLNPSEFRSGASRSDYPPPVDSYVVPQAQPEPRLITPPENGSSLKSLNEPADRVPKLTEPETTTETAKPRAEIRRDWTIIPDPEANRTIDAKPQTNKAPTLLRTEDRTAFTQQGLKTYQQASHRESQKPVTTYKVFGDDAWKPAGR